MSIKYDAETQVKAVRLVTEHAGDYDTEWAAITAISKRLGIVAGDAAPLGPSSAGRCWSTVGGVDGVGS